MEDQAKPHQKWWQQINRHSVQAILIAFLAVVIVLTILSILGYIYNWDWTGLGPYVSPPHSKDSDFQRGKTLWDWLQLLIIPAVLAVAGYIINLTISRGEQAATEQRAQSERETAEKRAQTEREIAQDNQQEGTLQEYINKMSELLLERDLRKSGMDAEVRTIAHVRTLTVLRRLNGERKGDVLRFLYESDLISKGRCIIDLHEADFSEARVDEADLSSTDLSGADFFRASLPKVNLENTDLIGTYFTQADMTCTNLRRANLSEAKLARTVLEGANLSEANLSGAKLEGAVLYNEIRSFVLLDGKMTNIEYGQTTNLKDAKVTQAQLDQASTLEGAIMPDGSIHP